MTTFAIDWFSFGVGVASAVVFLLAALGVIGGNGVD